MGRTVAKRGQEIKNDLTVSGWSLNPRQFVGLGNLWTVTLPQPLRLYSIRADRARGTAESLGSPLVNPVAFL